MTEFLRAGIVTRSARYLQVSADSRAAASEDVTYYPAAIAANGLLVNKQEAMWAA